ncbi:permease for cytosine/purines, uracil, thiamine, allantoin-domain-containing protein [Aspergillus caelatus]|uniref:Permease for cytosine/purines, uracil, thiamine, allantoin-domain-containing protein n=1 Tax=Aspergillus caelatus TaxID=61420 RepID=A0A5N6ZMB2_9EURO|nr:permease for cytosine/purines, uracil, thiamine, allantoin-domain-containing protein [Aspergillus caelatus]KAE8358528.1 permease for cytosine/purines, uracil, thiamine, allantoin-domain-containing protein [Aspergillus caelatus]
MTEDKSPTDGSNNDIKPIEADRRIWTFWTFHNFCVLASSNISVYMIGSSLIAMGLTWRQSLAAIVVGNIIAVGLLVINSLPGMFYHIGFPLVNRYVWGLYGSLFVQWNRILHSIVWFWPSLESRIPIHMPESTGMTTAHFVAYIIFMILSLPVLHIRPTKLQIFFYISSATIVAPDGRLLSGIMSSTMGGAAAGILNQNDYTRFARTPREAILGQLVSFPCYSILCATVGILVTAATQNRYGKPLWSLPALLSAIMEDGRFTLKSGRMGLNGLTWAATLPKYINLRRGAYITALVSVACNPWKLVNTATTFLAVLSSYSIFSRTHGIYYWYTYGVNWRAPVAWLCELVPSLPGFVAHVDPGVVIPVEFTRIYYVYFLTGTAISAARYTALRYIFPTPEVRTFVQKAPSLAVLMQEYRSRWDREEDSGNEIITDFLMN